MDPILKHNEEQIGDINAGDHLSCSYQKMVEFYILRGGKKAKSGIISPNFSRRESDLFKDLLGRITWQMVVERKVQENLIVRDVLRQP